METRPILDLDEYCEGSVLLDGYEHAIIGVVDSFEGRRILYSKEQIIDSLCKDGMTWLEAEEYFDYNIKNGYFGELSPVFLTHTVMPIKTHGEYKYEFIS
jgi:hypothetical protein